MATAATYAGDDDESCSTFSASDYHSANGLRSEYSYILDFDHTPNDVELNADASFSYFTTGFGSGTLPHPSSLHQNPQRDAVGSQFSQAQASTVQGQNNGPWLADSNDDLAPFADSFDFPMGSRQTSPTGSFDYQIIPDDDYSRNNGSCEVDVQFMSTAQIISSAGEECEGVAQDRGRGSDPWNPFVVVSNQSPNDTHAEPRFDQDLPSMYGNMSLNDHGSHGTISSASEYSHLNHGTGTTWNSSAMGQGTTDTSFPPDIFESVATLRPAPELNGMPTIHYMSQSRSVAATESVYYDAESPDSIEICYEDAGEAMSPNAGPSHAAQMLEVPDQLQSAAGPPSPAVTVPPHGVARLLECPQRGCHARFTGKYRQGNLQRHLRLKHGSKERVYLCEQEGCGKTFKRQDARLKHYRNKHPLLAPEPPAARH